MDFAYNSMLLPTTTDVKRNHPLGHCQVIVGTIRLQGVYNEELNRLRKIRLMIFDDFLLLPTSPEEQQDLPILPRARDEDHSSTVLCSQISLEGWHERLGSGGVADTLLDRITSNGFEINIDGDVSMRRRHSRI